MNETFRVLLGRYVIIYLDDILIYSRTVTSVLQRLRQHHLFLKLEKCEFHQSTTHFLGYIITHTQVTMDQGKVDAVRNWPQPKTVRELQRFLGFANFYRCFIAGFSSVAAPFTAMTGQKVRSLSWNPDALQAFTRLKEAFCTVPILCLPDPDLPFTIEVVASSSGVGAVLSQWQATTLFLRPCAYFLCLHPRCVCHVYLSCRLSSVIRPV